jgi:hypothetical protein
VGDGVSYVYVFTIEKVWGGMVILFIRWVYVGDFLMKNAE